MGLIKSNIIKIFRNNNMEDFDFNMDNEVGTSISKLKEKQIDIKFSDSDHIDYDKILENIDYSETMQNDNKYEKKDVEHFSKKNINMNQLARNLELGLDNFHDNPNKFSNNFTNNNSNSMPMPANYTKKMIPKQHYIESLVNLDEKPKVTPTPIPTPEIKPTTNIDSVLDKIVNFEHRDILVLCLLFILLNNKFIIEFVYDRFEFVRTVNSPYPNLLIRSLIFGIIIYIIKKFNL